MEGEIKEQLPSIPKIHNKVQLNRRLNSSERKRIIEKRINTNIPKCTEIVGTLITLDKNLDVTFNDNVGNR